MIEILALGFVIGLGHALEADHLAALSTMAAKERRRDHIVRHGVSWGLGHAIMLFVVGGFAIWFQQHLDERIAESLEALVGFMLIALGIGVLWRLLRDRIHIHRHRHDDGTQHLHAHSHRHDQGNHDPSDHHHAHPSHLSPGALVIGLVHGMAGSAALVVLVASTLSTPVFGLIYIALFGLGSVIGMGLLSAVIAIPLTWTAKGLTVVHQIVQCGIAFGAIGLGGLTLAERLPAILTV